MGAICTTVRDILQQLGIAQEDEYQKLENAYVYAVCIPYVLRYYNLKRQPRAIYYTRASSCVNKLYRLLT